MIPRNTDASVAEYELCKVAIPPRAIYYIYMIIYRHVAVYALQPILMGTYGINRGWHVSFLDGWGAYPKTVTIACVYSDPTIAGKSLAGARNAEALKSSTPRSVGMIESSQAIAGIT